MMLSAIAVQQIINGVTQVIQAPDGSGHSSAPPYGRSVRGRFVFVTSATRIGKVL